MPSEWARGETKRLKNEMFRDASSDPEEFWAEALDAARAQGRLEGVAEVRELCHARATKWKDEFPIMAATAECIADFIENRIEELQK